MGIAIYTCGNNFDGKNISAENSELTEKNTKNDRKEASSFFAGNFLNNDPIEQKRKEAQQKAWKVISEAWDMDKEIDQMIYDLEDEFKQLQKSKSITEAEIANVNENMNNLKEEYGITPESREQQELELLMKKQDYDNGVSTTPLTAEEFLEYNNIDTDHLTDYQSKMLQFNDIRSTHTKELNKINDAMKDITVGITTIQIDRLKEHPMADANRQAKEIKEAASKEIIGMLTDEAKENIDEKSQEAKEEAEKAAEEKEKKEKEEEKVESPDIQSLSDKLNTVNKSIDEIKNNMNLIEADLQGIKIDEIV